MCGHKITGSWKTIPLIFLCFCGYLLKRPADMKEIARSDEKYWIHDDLTVLYGTFNGFAPSSFDLFNPWNSTFFFVDRLDLSPSGRWPMEDNNVKKASLRAGLTLLPSPGEYFFLRVKCLDEVLGEFSTAVLLQVGVYFQHCNSCYSRIC